VNACAATTAPWRAARVSLIRSPWDRAPIQAPSLTANRPILIRRNERLKSKTYANLPALAEERSALLNAPDRHVLVREPVLAWSNDGLRDYGGVQQQLPVLEESITQLGAGTFSARAAIVSAGDVVLYRARPEVLSIGVTVLDPAYAAFAMPISWEGEYLINGQTGKASSLYPPSAGGIVYVRGGRRDTLGVIVRRSRLIDTVAALRGVSPDEVALDGRPHELRPAGAAALRRRLVAMIDAYCGGGLPSAPRDGSAGFAEEVFGLVADAYLYARPGEARKGGGVDRLAPIVRRAEQRFADANAEPISLADA